MSRLDVTYLVAGVCALAGAAAFIGLILVPAVTAYTRVWQRVAAGVLSLLRARGDGRDRRARCLRRLRALDQLRIVVRRVTDALDLAALDEITAAVQTGAGLPAVVRAAARVLDASVVVFDRGGPGRRRGGALAGRRAVAARRRRRRRRRSSCASATPRSARCACARAAAPAQGLMRLVSTLIASEVERVRAPERASEEAIAGFVAALLRREIADARRAARPRRARSGCATLERGGSVLIAHAHPQAPAQEGWRTRLRAIAARAARAAVAGRGRGALRARPRLGRRGRRRARRRRRAGRAARRRERAARPRGRRWPASSSSSGAAAPTSDPARARARRRRGAAGGQRRRGRRRSTACSPSRRPAPTACCSAR